MAGRTDRRVRVFVVLACVLAFALAATIRLAYWQVVRADDLRDRALAQLGQPARLPAVRGDILDRHGAVLATTGYRDTLGAYPDTISEATAGALVDALGEILRLDEAARRDLAAKLGSHARYAVLEREITEAQSVAVRAGLEDGSLSGLALEPHPVRIYPSPGGAPGTTLASQLLGYVGADGHGYYGIEQYYDAVLAGRPKLLASAGSVGSAPAAGSGDVVDPGEDGQDIRLTLDAGLQLQLEKELYAAWVLDRSKRVSGLIMDPDTGEILAWASVPGYDANDYARVFRTRRELFRDALASDPYEPGSVMKMITATAALQNGTVTLRKRVKDVTQLRFGTDLVRNADWSAMGWIPFRDVIAYSRNVATARVARKLGRSVRSSSNVLWRTWQQLGIGEPTGVDIANEYPGRAADPRRDRWAPIDLANRAFGQSVSVTSVQLATAYTPMINGGMRVQPHFLRAVGDERVEPPAPRRVIGKSLAGKLRAIMQHVTSAVPWYAEGSLIPGWTVGGKTGTAQIWRVDQGRYAYRNFNFSFVGFVGGDRPEAIVAVRIHDTTPKILGRGLLDLKITSYELFRRIAVRIIETLHIARSHDPRAGMPERGSLAERVFAQEAAEQRQRQEARQERLREQRQTGSSHDRTGARGGQASAGSRDAERSDREQKARREGRGGSRNAAEDERGSQRAGSPARR
jgi:cell division protein FtsI/penicillin-binding protein 2